MQPTPFYYYTRHSHLPLDEDIGVEFKAHRDLSNLDMSTLKFTVNRNGEQTLTKVLLRRHTLSKYLNGMLNTGLGGTFYLGVRDNAQVQGLMMTLYQKDHFMVALRDLFDQFKPPVSLDEYKVRFVPVFEDKEDAERCRATLDMVGLDDPPRGRAHDIRLSRYCWCDHHAMAGFNFGRLHPFYVIEIEFRKPKKRTVYANEEGQVYERLNATTRQVFYDDHPQVKKEGENGLSDEREFKEDFPEKTKKIIRNGYNGLSKEKVLRTSHLAIRGYSEELETKDEVEEEEFESSCEDKESCDEAYFTAEECEDDHGVLGCLKDISDMF